jgi:hypothetical protein
MDRLRYALTGGALAVLAPAAAASCPANATESALELYIAGSQPGADIPSIAAKAGTLTDACPEDAYAGSILAPLNLAIVETAPSPEEKQAWAVRAWRAFRASSRGFAGGAGLPMRTVQSSAGPVDVKPVYDAQLPNAILTALASAEAQTGKPSAFSRPAGPGAPPPACEPIDGDIMAISYATGLSSVGAGWTVRLAMTDQRIAACEGKLAPRSIMWLYGSSAKIRHDALNLGLKPAPADPAAMARTAKTHLERLFEISSNGLQSYFVSKADRPKMDQVLATFIPPLPQSEWFLPETIGSEYAIYAIGLALDAAWAKDQKAGDIASTAYSGLITSIFKTAEAQSDPVKARLMLHQAAKRHAEGKIRRPESAGLKAPAGFLWEWTNPYHSPR